MQIFGTLEVYFASTCGALFCCSVSLSKLQLLGQPDEFLRLPIIFSPRGAQMNFTSQSATKLVAAYIFII